MSENDYECPKCHNVFPKSNQFLHDMRCTGENPLPLNASRLVGPKNNNTENKNREPIQHRPQPKITTKRRPDSHIKPLDVKESVMKAPETFNCWLCGQTFSESEREDHMLCHQMEEENEKYKNQQRNNPPPNQQFQRPRVNLNPPPQQPQKPPQHPPQQQIRAAQIQPMQPYRPPQLKKNDLKRSFVPFDDLQIFDFKKVRESLNVMNSPTDIDILNELPETEISDINRLDPQKRSCVICSNKYKNGEKATMLPCIHMFHSQCVQEWLRTKNFCPVCKYKLTKESLGL